METVACNLCGSVRQELVWEGEDWAYGCPGRFTMVRCPDCGLIFLNPRPTPDEMDSYYPNNYEPYLRTISAPRSQLLDLVQRVKLRSRVRVVTRIAKEGRLLDVGCATGGFIHEMRRTGGWQVQGVEINADMVRFAREQLGLDVFRGRLEEAWFPDETFDVVTMWDVLEHVHDPQATLQEVHRILGPGGVFLGSVPNADSLDARLFGRYWVGLDFPRHLYVYSPATLGTLLRKANLEPERFFCFYGRYTTFALSVSRWLNARIHSRAWQRWLNARIHSRAWQRRLRSILLFPAFRYLTLPYFSLIDALKHGTIITVQAQKNS